MLRVSSSPRKKNAPRPADKSAPGFLKYVRGRECVFVGTGHCEGKIEAAHLDFAGDKGMGTKVSDKFAVPMCSAHHRLQHAIGWQSFMAAMLTNEKQLLDAAGFLWARWPGRAQWERKLEQ